MLTQDCSIFNCHSSKAAPWIFFFFEYQQRMATKVETGKTTFVAVITRDRVTDNLKTQLAIGQKFFVLLPTLCLQYT